MHQTSIFSNQNFRALQDLSLSLSFSLSRKNTQTYLSIELPRALSSTMVSSLRRTVAPSSPWHIVTPPCSAQTPRHYSSSFFFFFNILFGCILQLVHDCSFIYFFRRLLYCLGLVSIFSLRKEANKTWYFILPTEIMCIWDCLGLAFYCFLLKLCFEIMCIWLGYAFFLLVFFFVDYAMKNKIMCSKIMILWYF